MEAGFIDGSRVSGQLVNQVASADVPDVDVAIPTATGHVSTTRGPSATKQILLEGVQVALHNLNERKTMGGVNFLEAKYWCFPTSTPQVNSNTTQQHLIREGLTRCTFFPCKRIFKTAPNYVDLAQ